MERRIAAPSTRRTMPLCMKSTPSTMPTGRATRKLPEITRTVALAIGVFGRPWLNAASISKRNWPAASWAQSSATGSVMRMPWLKREVWPLAASCSVTCGRNPCTSTILMPMACRMARSCTKVLSLPAAIASPVEADDEGLAAVGVDMRRHQPKPGDEGVRENEAHRGGDCAAA
jgi:hypothetical protein